MVYHSSSALEELGFSLNKKVWYIALMSISLIVLIAVTSENVEWNFKLSSAGVFATIGASLEEVVFRSLLTGLLVRHLPSFRGKVITSIFLSSLIFTLAHYPNHPFSFLWSLFQAAVVVTLLYWWSKSNLFGIVAHTISNAGISYGIYAFLIYFLLSGSLRVLSQSRYASTLYQGNTNDIS